MIATDELKGSSDLQKLPQTQFGTYMKNTLPQNRSTLLLLHTIYSIMPTLISNEKS